MTAEHTVQANPPPPLPGHTVQVPPLDPPEKRDRSSTLKASGASPTLSNLKSADSLDAFLNRKSSETEGDTLQKGI